MGASSVHFLFKDKENITGVCVGETLCLQEQNTPVVVDRRE